MAKKYSDEFMVERDRYWTCEERPGEFVLRVVAATDVAGSIGIDTMETIGKYPSADDALRAARQRSQKPWR